MNKNRLEAFSDGVIAIIITIMVLELKVPKGDSWEAVQEIIPKFMSYIVSFTYVAIYWNNHHHLLHTVHKVTASILWANINLLFWLSLVPFVTAWAGEYHLKQLPVAAYVADCLLAGVSYTILSRAIIKSHGSDSILSDAIGKDYKGKTSMILYAIGIPLSFYATWITVAIIVFVAIMWLVPDKRIEKTLKVQNQ